MVLLGCEQMVGSTCQGSTKHPPSTFQCGVFAVKGCGAWSYQLSVNKSLKVEANLRTCGSKHHTAKQVVGCRFIVPTVVVVVAVVHSGPGCVPQIFVLKL